MTLGVEIEDDGEGLLCPSTPLIRPHPFLYYYDRWFNATSPVVATITLHLKMASLSTSRSESVAYSAATSHNPGASMRELGNELHFTFTTRIIVHRFSPQYLGERGGEVVIGVSGALAVDSDVKCKFDLFNAVPRSARGESA